MISELIEHIVRAVVTAKGQIATDKSVAFAATRAASVVVTTSATPLLIVSETLVASKDCSTLGEASKDFEVLASFGFVACSFAAVKALPVSFRFATHMP